MFDSVCDTGKMTSQEQDRAGRCRLDAALVRLGLYATREQALRALLAGEVEVQGRRDSKPGLQVKLAETPDGLRLYRGSVALDVHVRATMPYVGRGGLKLEAALDAFGIVPRDMVALDIGASTGGFTDCLLQRGVRRVYAVDCGTGQLHAKLRADDRVVVREKTNARFLVRADVPETPGIIVADVSFISVRLLLPVMHALGAPGTIVVVLVKPQFEAGADKVGKGGVVRDEAVRRATVASVRAAMEELGWTCVGEIESPLHGPAGNIEYLLAARIGPHA